jgi:hypothetical protein
MKDGQAMIRIVRDSIAGEFPMREWVLALGPVVVAIWILTNPVQFERLLYWLGQFVQP